jgi:alpha-galactosidase
MAAMKSQSRGSIDTVLGWVLLLVVVLLGTALAGPVAAQIPGAGGLDFERVGDPGAFEARYQVTNLAPGLDELTVHLTAAEPAVPQPFSLEWSIASHDVKGHWSTRAYFDKNVDPDWGPSKVRSMLARDAPVITLFGSDDGNRLTFAASDALNAVTLSASVREEDGRIHNRIELFNERHSAVTEYSITIRLDQRPVHFAKALGDVADWWASLPGFEPAAVPEAARTPVYSTWYSYHQNLQAEALLGEMRRAREIGFETIIVDDGWQTLDSNRGYAFTGDWRPERLPQMGELVAAMHDLDVRFVLWYALPFIGEKSTLFPRFKGKYLRYWDGQGAWELDPRYPEVRQHIIEVYTAALQKWDLDGFKLDFVGRFVANESTVLEAAEGRDFASVNEATDRLLTDLMKATRSINPEVMIEFRQPYIGPLMRKYGNMFRAGDAPNAYVANRVRTIDLRLLSGDTAVHSDMIMWHPEEAVEQAALQLLNVMFSVPQVSVRLEGIPRQHLEMVTFYTGYWSENRDVLLEGDLRPSDPSSNYPMVVGSSETKKIVGLYQDLVVRLDAADAGFAVDVLNGRAGERVVFDIGADLGAYRFSARDCLGAVVATGQVELSSGPHGFDVPAAGVLSLEPLD